ncbi:GtrA family protein [Salipiger sp. CCB-MM3]|uniref:GtrA family protein n=1 Tax=Salipiger sp. CCB-MM3 TaxID=1792508 RepID=UPI00187DAF21|nr:GtrA family protein [Salipiger sp. CCB-MM3]
MRRLSAALNTPDTLRFIKFLAVGLLNTLFGYVVFALLVMLGIPPQLALALAFVLGVLWNYQTHARLVFAVRGFQRLPGYLAAYLAIYGMNAGALAALMHLGLGPALAQALFLPVAAVLSYVAIGRVLTGCFPWRRPAPR